MTTIYDSVDAEEALRRSIFLWRAGRIVPLYLTARLEAAGYIVADLERQYRA